MWLLIAVALGAVAQAQTPAPPPGQTQQPPSAKPGVATPDDASDEGFIEFLGSDDVGDAAWWEFLKRAPPRGNTPSAPPPQDASK